jgi:catechol 2,3-dioxygenase-like lactoylglutathione lyase family enzyme
MIAGIHHIGIGVADLDIAKNFYCDVLGMELLWGTEINGDDLQSDAVVGLRNVKARMCMLQSGGCRVELWEYHNPASAAFDPAYAPSNRGITHFCLEVQDIAREHTRLRAAGMTFVGPPVAMAGMTAVYGRDPFGNIIEIYEETGED